MVNLPEIKVQVIAPDMFTISTMPEPSGEELSPVDETLRLIPLLEATAFPVLSILEPNRLAI